MPSADLTGGLSRAPRKRWGVTVVFLLALLIRLLHLATIRSSVSFNHLILDPLAYDEWGQRIAAGDWLGTQTFYQDPLYPYFLGILYKILGHTFSGVIAVQCLLGAFIPVLIYTASRPWLGHRCGLLAGVLAALYLPSVYYEGLILKSWLGAFLTALVLALFSQTLAGRIRPWAGWLAGGFFLGLGCLVRGNLLLFIPCSALWLLLHRSGRRAPDTGGRPSGRPTRQAQDQAAVRHPNDPVRGGRMALLVARLDWQAPVLLLAGCALVLAPMALRNRLVGGEWVLTTSQGGQNFYIGNNPANQNGRYEPLPFVGANPKYEEKGFSREAQRRTGRSLSPAQVSRYWMRQAGQWIMEHPADWLHLTWLKVRNFWGAYEVPDNLDYYLYRKTAPILRLPLPGFGLLAPLALLGAWLLRKQPGWPRVVLLYAALYSVSVIAFFVFSRYRLALMPALFPLAGKALLELAQRARQAMNGHLPWAPVLRLAALGLSLMAFVNLPVHAPAGDWSLRLAGAFRLPLQAETSATGHYNLGLSYAHQADSAPDTAPLLEKALAEYRQAVQEDPRFPAPYAEMGKVLARLHRDREAADAYGKVILLDPSRARPHHVLGLLFRRLNNFRAAAREFRRALDLDPRRVDSAVALGQVLLDMDRPVEAAAAFRQALALEPHHAAALKGLSASQARSS